MMKDGFNKSTMMKDGNNSTNEIIQKIYAKKSIGKTKINVANPDNNHNGKTGKENMVSIVLQISSSEQIHHNRTTEIIHEDANAFSEEDKLTIDD